MTVNAFEVSVLDSLTAHIAVLNAQGVIVAVNKAWRQFGRDNGLPEPSLSMLGVNYLDTCKNVVNQPDGDEVNTAQAGIVAVLAGEQESFYLEYPCHSPNQQRWFSMVVLPLQDSRGGAVVGHENITERKMAEKKLTESESMLATILENVSAYIYLKDCNGRYLFANRLCLELWGLPIEKVIGVTDEDLFDSQMAATIREHDRRVLVNGESVALEESSKAIKTDKTASYWTVKIPLRNADGSIYGLCGISTDITAYKQTKVKLRDEQKRITAILETVGSPIFVKNNDHRIILANRAFYDMFGLDENAVIGYTLAENIPVDEMKHFLEVDRRVLDTGIPEQCEEALTVRGTTLTILTKKTRLINDSGEKFLVCAIHDITERVKMEQALIASEKEFRLLAESMPQIVWITRADGECIYFNQQWVY